MWVFDRRVSTRFGDFLLLVRVSGSPPEKAAAMAGFDPGDEERAARTPPGRTRTPPAGSIRHQAPRAPAYEDTCRAACPSHCPRPRLRSRQSEQGPVGIPSAIQNGRETLLGSFDIKAEKPQSLCHTSIHRRAFVRLDCPVEFKSAEISEMAKFEF